MKYLWFLLLLAVPAVAEISGCFMAVDNVSTNTTYAATTNSYPVAGRVRQVDIYATTNMTIMLESSDSFGTGWGGVRTALVETAVSPGRTRVTNSYDFPLFADFMVLKHKSAANGTNSLYVTLTLEQ